MPASPSLWLALLALVATVGVRVVGATHNDTDPFVVGMVRDIYLRYAGPDNNIYQGVAYWANWINSLGGLQYGDYARQVQIVTVDTSTLNASASLDLVKEAYTSMVEDQNIDLAVSPYTTDRATASISVTEKYNLFNFGTSGSDVLFKSNYTGYFSAIAASSKNPLFTLKIVAGLRNVKSYSIFASTDTVSQSSVTTSLKFLATTTLTQKIVFNFDVASSTDPTYNYQEFSGLISNFSSQGDIGDVMLVFMTSDYFPYLVTAVANQKLNISLAVSVIPMSLITSSDAETVIGFADNWLLDIPFIPSYNFGTSGFLGGTSQEFWDSFYAEFGNYPDSFTALCVANLMAYTEAVQIAQSVNKTLVRQALINMPTLNTFYGKIKFYNNGSNPLAQYATIQYQGNTPALVNASTIVYPAQWSWLPAPPTAIKYVRIITPLSAALAAIIGVGILLTLFAGVMLYLHYTEYNQGAFYSGLLIFGCLLSFLAALSVVPEPSEALCVIFPWFLGVGFTLVYGCLFIKTWALYKVWRKAEQLQKSTLTPTYIMKGISIYMVLEITLLIIWTNVDKPKPEWRKMVDDSYHLQCRTKSVVFWAIFLSTKGAWLVFGAILSVLTRRLATQFNKSKNIAYSVYNIVVLLIIGVPLAIMLENISGGVIIIQVAVVVIAFSFTLISLFFDIWYNIVFPAPSLIGGLKLSTVTTSVGKTSSNGKVSSSSANSSS